MKNDRVRNMMMAQLVMSALLSIFIFMSVSQVTLVVGEENRAILYDDFNMRGNALTVWRTGEYCNELPSSWYSRARSVNTGGGCITLWDQAGCQGNREELRYGSLKYADRDLRKRRGTRAPRTWDRAAQSLSFC